MVIIVTTLSVFIYTKKWPETYVPVHHEDKPLEAYKTDAKGGWTTYKGKNGQGKFSLQHMLGEYGINPYFVYKADDDVLGLGINSSNVQPINGIQNFIISFYAFDKSKQLSDGYKSDGMGNNVICESFIKTAYIDNKKFEKKNCILGLLGSSEPVENYSYETSDKYYRIDINYGTSVDKNEKALVRSFLETYKITE